MNVAAMVSNKSILIPLSMALTEAGAQTRIRQLLCSLRLYDGIIQMMSVKHDIFSLTPCAGRMLSIRGGIGVARSQ